MSGPHIQDMQLSSFPLLRSLLDECRTEHELRSVCARISPLLRARVDREELVAYVHHLKDRRKVNDLLKALDTGKDEQGEQTSLMRPGT